MFCSSDTELALQNLYFILFHSSISFRNSETFSAITPVDLRTAQIRILYLKVQETRRLGRMALHYLDWLLTTRSGPIQTHHRLIWRTPIKRSLSLYGVWFKTVTHVLVYTFEHLNKSFSLFKGGAMQCFTTDVSYCLR